MTTKEITVRHSGLREDPRYVAYMTIECIKGKIVKRYFVKKDEVTKEGELRITMIREYKTRNALMNFMRKLPNN